ncbi:MAG TPA: BolA family protein [Microvirga sp.]|nr:BolA family protein [Microvirga sp.]
MTMQELITRALEERFAPTQLTVTDESHQHHGHSGWREGGETHFRLNIVSPAFAGKSRVERHRLVNDALKPAFARGLHALAIKAQAPGE